MRSAIFTGCGHPLEIQERPIPTPGPRQALIQVARCGICASDIHMTSGGPFDWPSGVALGHEYAGEVVALGPDCERLKVGDRVTAVPISSCGQCPACLADTPLHCPHFQPMAGGYSEYTLVDERVSMRLPQSLSFADGALVEPLASALRGVRKLSGLSGAKVAVIGAGAIGAASIYWLNQMGAGPIAAIARSRRNEDLALAVGAKALLTTGDGLAERLHETLGGAPDIVVEAAGATGILQQAIGLVRTNGEILSLGGCITPDPILPMLGMVKEATLRFSVAYGAGEFRHALETMDKGAVSPRAMVSDTISLSDLPERFEAIRKGAPYAKVMVDPKAI